MMTLIFTFSGARQSRFCLGSLGLWVVTGLLLAVSSKTLAGDDALESPALPSDLADRSMLLDITRAGDRLITVGERGHILYSEDEGKTWQQAEVPVRVTLTAVDFPTPERGYAVGHDGVVLVSDDAGNTWTRQLTGDRLNIIVKDQLQELREKLENGRSIEEIAVSPDDLALLAEDAERFVEEGPTRPLLDVSFRNERVGVAVGAYGVVLETRDGGASWHSLVGRLDNPFGFHLYDIAHVGETIFIAGEAGSLHRSKDGGASWEKLDTPYQGTFFGLLGKTEPDLLIVHGLRGNVYQSADFGDTWEKIDTGVEASIEGGALMRNGDVVLVGHGGTLLTGKPASPGYLSHNLPGRHSLSDITSTRDGHLVIAGDWGVRRIDPKNIIVTVGNNDN